MKHLKKLFIPIILLITIILSVVLPPSGKTALLDEFCSIIIIWIVAFYITWKYVKSLKSNKVKKISTKFLHIIIITVFIILALLFSKDLAMDIFYGPQSILLYETQISHTQGHTGIFSNHYYLSGKDKDRSVYRLEISCKQYEILSKYNMRKIEVEYYKYTKRLFKYY